MCQALGINSPRAHVNGHIGAKFLKFIFYPERNSGKENLFLFFSSSSFPLNNYFSSFFLHVCSATYLCHKHIPSYTYMYKMLIIEESMLATYCVPCSIVTRRLKFLRDLNFKNFPGKSSIREIRTSQVRVLMFSIYTV